MAEYKDVEQMKKQIADFKRAVNAVEPMNSDYLTGYISALSVIEGVIAEQPATDVTPVKHGHWVNEYDCGYTTPHCSECGEIALTKEETSYDYVYSSYCPHCGCKMNMDGGDGNE